jgi:hypothetical protein
MSPRGPLSKRNGRRVAPTAGPHWRLAGVSARRLRALKWLQVEPRPVDARGAARKKKGPAQGGQGVTAWVSVVRFVITSGTGADEIVDWRPDARSACQHVMHLISLKRPRIRIFDSDGHQVSLKELQDLAGPKGNWGASRLLSVAQTRAPRYKCDAASPSTNGGSSMPLKRMLDDNRTFDPKAVAILLEAFNDIVAALDLRTDADREKAAKIVIRLAHGQTDFDAAKIRDEAVRLMRKQGLGRRRPF